MKIGILACALPPDPVLQAHGPFTTMFEQLLSGHGFTFQTWQVEQMEFPSTIDQADAWVITGARHGAYEDHAFIPPLERFIQTAHAARTPMLGICFGHQIIAQAMGATVRKFDKGWSVGRKEYVMEGLGQIHLNAFHQDQVLDLPKGARIIASNSFTQFAGLAYGDHCITLQPHPEITPQIIRTYVDWNLVRDQSPFSAELLRDVREKTDLPGDEAKIGQTLGHFLKAAHKARAAIA